MALATTEHAVAIENGVSGVVGTSVPRLVEAMRALIDHAAARRLSDGARKRARERYGIERFAREWDAAIDDVRA